MENALPQWPGGLQVFYLQRFLSVNIHKYTVLSICQAHRLHGNVRGRRTAPRRRRKPPRSGSLTGAGHVPLPSAAAFRHLARALIYSFREAASPRALPHAAAGARGSARHVQARGEQRRPQPRAPAGHMKGARLGACVQPAERCHGGGTAPALWVPAAPGTWSFPQDKRLFAALRGERRRGLQKAARSRPRLSPRTSAHGLGATVSYSCRAIFSPRI